MASTLQEEKYPSESNDSGNEKGDEIMQTEIFGKPEDIPGTSSECDIRINKSPKLRINPATVGILINRTVPNVINRENSHLDENLTASIKQQDLSKADISSFDEKILEIQRQIDDLEHKLDNFQNIYSQFRSKHEKEKKGKKNLYDNKHRLLAQVSKYEGAGKNQLESCLLEVRAIPGQQEIGADLQDVGILHKGSRVSVNPVIDRENINQQVKSVNNWVDDPADTDSGCCMRLFSFWK